MSSDYLIQSSPQPALFVWSEESIKGSLSEAVLAMQFFHHECDISDMGPVRSQSNVVSLSVAV
jgi:hypothetical protein